MIDRKRGGLAKRYQASYESRDSGMSSKSVMDWGKVDGDVTFFTPIEGKNRINIIPYVIKTRNHPLVRRRGYEIGDLDYVMDIYVHRNVGPSEANVICLKSTFGKPCPICEQAALLRKQGKEKEAAELKPSRRVFYNVQDMKEPDKLKVFETSHYLFEKELIDESRDNDEGGFVDFADPDDGREIKFRAREVQKGTMKYKEFKSFSFEKRDEPISDELLESAISFDEVMNVPTYEEVEKILFGTDSDDEEDDEKFDKEFDESSYDDDEEKPVKKPSKNREEDDEPSNEAVAEVGEKFEPPSKSCGNCPFGHRFGKDCDEFDDCGNCDNWDKCVKCD